MMMKTCFNTCIHTHTHTYKNKKIQNDYGKVIQKEQLKKMKFCKQFRI